MKRARPFLAAALTTLISFSAASCETDQPKKKKRPPLPGEEDSDLSWSRPTGPNEISTPFGIPTSR